MPRKSHITQARACRAEIARRVLHPLGAIPPVAEISHIEESEQSHQSGHKGTLTQWTGTNSREDLDLELASFCQRFDLEPQVQDFESDTDGDDAHGSDADHDPSNRPEIAEQSELEHFSAVLQRAQQIAIQLEKKKEMSRKRKTPRHYTGKSLKTSYRHKRARLQLAEKGFLGVFEYIGLQKHTRAQKVSNGASDLTQEPSAKEGPVPEEEEEEEEGPIPEEEEEESLDDGAVDADISTAAAMLASTTAASAMSTSVTAASAMSTSVTAASAMSTSVTAASMTPTSVTVASAMTTSMTAPGVMAVGATAPDAAAAIMNAVAVVVEVVKGHPNGPRQDNQALKMVRVLIPKPVRTDGMLGQGADNDTLLEIVERSTKALSDEGVSDNVSGEDEHTNSPIHAEARHAINAMLEDLRQRCAETVTCSAGDPLSAADRALNLWKDHTVLCTACVKLMDKCKDKSLDVFLRARITAMVGILNLYLDNALSYTWRNVSLVAAKAQRQGITHACNLHKWILDFVQYGRLPLHRFSQARWTILEDEDILQSLQLQLGECAKHGYIKAADVVKIVSSPEMQASLKRIGVCKPTITEWTACNWLKKLNWRYQQKQNGMYIDGHERDNVVQYRKAFVARWKEYTKHFHKWDNDGNPLPLPTSFPIPGGRFHLILITHDESTFYQNDKRKTHWVHSSMTATLKPKGNGQSLMVLDFLTVEWGRLRHGNECVFSLLDSCLCLTHPNTHSEARILLLRSYQRHLPTGDDYWGKR